MDINNKLAALNLRQNMEDSVMSGMAVSPASKMPIELWDKVFKYLMPTDEELT